MCSCPFEGMPVISLMSESAVRKHLRLRFRTDIFLFKGNHEDHPMPALNDTSIPDSSIDLHSSDASPALPVVAATPRTQLHKSPFISIICILY